VCNTGRGRIEIRKEKNYNTLSWICRFRQQINTETLKKLKFDNVLEEIVAIHEEMKTLD
jgi:hypothetical protein